MSFRLDVALDDAHRDVPFPDRLDQFIRVVDHIADWNTNRAYPLRFKLPSEYQRFQAVYASRLRATPGFDRLALICARETGEDPGPEFLRRVRGRLGTGD